MIVKTVMGNKYSDIKTCVMSGTRSDNRRSMIAAIRVKNQAWW